MKVMKFNTVIPYYSEFFHVSLKIKRNSKQFNQKITAQKYFVICFSILFLMKRKGETRNEIIFFAIPGGSLQFILFLVKDIREANSVFK